MFSHQIRKTMEVYVNDILVKSKHVEDHYQHLVEMFYILRKHGMKLNPRKCTFGISSGKFLSYMVANPEKIRAIIQMKAPTEPKEVQSLTGRIVALSQLYQSPPIGSSPSSTHYEGGKSLNGPQDAKVHSTN